MKQEDLKEIEELLNHGAHMSGNWASEPGYDDDVMQERFDAMLEKIAFEINQSADTS